ncbi:PepSY-associated TM helix domain-containing protein [Caulobacter soli]|uniref:PepSY-associated TM helix domain-containing protein n=1 Tax=Caulobacter soli TaxID=2708539 RepID=UPI0013EA99B3|nr:PepSY-associated TM helix domain-containing protein [Caulobacter soli]
MDARTQVPVEPRSAARFAPPALRPFLTFLHRWVGLFIAGFLFVSGVTGAVISWDHELDDVLNPHLMFAQSSKGGGKDGPVLAPLDLARQIEARDPRVQVTYLPLAPEPGGTLAFGVAPKRDPATGKLFEPHYNQVFIDPVTGAEQGRREWGAVWPITGETFVSFLYVLHYSLHIPAMWGIDRWGIWLLGGVAILWTLDCFVGFYLTLPPRQKTKPAKGFWARWKPAWVIKTSASAYRINFDIHRAFGLWLWGVLFTVAFTAFSLNLYSEVFYPIMSKVSKVTPSPFDLRKPADLNSPIIAARTYDQVLTTARAEAMKRGWQAPAGGAFYSPEYGIYGVAFHEPGGDHGAAGVGPPYLYYDGKTGALVGDSQPWKGTAADIFVQAQFPLHSGRILGVPGRILISLTGAVVAALSVTGVVIWLKKRKARVGRRRPRLAAA